jgi:hypothetical protein
MTTTIQQSQIPLDAITHISADPERMIWPDLQSDMGVHKRHVDGIDDAPVTAR